MVLRRALVATLAVLALMGVLLGRMTYLQVLGFQHYSTLSHENRVKLVAIPPTRGLIYDRNGVLLAENRPSFRLIVTPEEVRDMDDMLRRLGQVIELSAGDLERFRDLLARKRRFEEIPLKFRLSPEEVARFAVDRHRFPGVEVQAELSRHYPHGEVAVHALGYVGRINPQELQRLEEDGKLANYSGTSHIGKTGVERYYQDLLHGTVGVERIETNALGRPIRTLERDPPIPGQDIYLTLDMRLQRAAEAALGDYSGSVVAIDPKNGEVLAFVSKPGYDPNLFVNGIDYATYQDLQRDHDQPLFNRALRGQYPPASTLKPFIGLAALEENTVAASSTVYCPGAYQLPGNDHRYRCWKRAGHAHTNLYEAIAESCDVYFYDVAYRLGIDAMSRHMDAFNFGRRTGIDLSGELSGINPSREWKRAAKGESWYHGETVIAGIGQGYWLTTPLQLAQATAILANRGHRIRPHLLYGRRPANAERPIRHLPEPAGDPIELKNDRHWDEVIAAMRGVVHGRTGTARRVSEDMEYEMAGKTGTSQVFGLPQDRSEYDPEEIALRLRDHALFIAFAPIEEPRLAVAVVVENGGSGSAVAAPIAREVIDAYLALDTEAAPEEAQASLQPRGSQS